MPRVIITVPEKNPQPYRFQLDRKVVSLGRGSDNDIVIDSGSVSGKHAEMRRVEGGYQLDDLGSTNGIKYNGDRMRIIPLRSGMTVKMGDVSFDFSLSEEELDIIGLEKPISGSPVVKENELPPLPKQLEESPERKPESSAASQTPRSQSSGGGLGMIMLFLILAGAAFFVGLSVRHQKETGAPLWKAIADKPTAEKTTTPPAADPAAVKK